MTRIILSFRVLFAPFLALSTAALISGCTVESAIERIDPTEFITSPNLLHKPDNTPFDLAWSAPDINAREYDTVVVNPVRTDKVNPGNWIYSASTFIVSSEGYLERVDELAKYIERDLTTKFAAYHTDDLKVLLDPDPPVETEQSASTIEQPGGAEPLGEPLSSFFPEGRTVVIDVSIAEADFGDPIIYGGLLAVPVPGVANMSTAVRAPSLTLEARLTDPQTGEVLTELVDRRFPQVKIVDINRLTVSSALHEIADSFSDDLVASFYRKHGERVGRRLPFSLLPW